MSTLACVRDQIVALHADVFLVQEVMGRTPKDRMHNGDDIDEVHDFRAPFVEPVYPLGYFVALAEDVGLDCRAPAGGNTSVPAFDPGRVRRGMGIMCAETVSTVAGSVVYDWGPCRTGWRLECARHPPPAIRHA